jgi:hypothetical protein
VPRANGLAEQHLGREPEQVGEIGQRAVVGGDVEARHADSTGAELRVEVAHAPQRGDHHVAGGLGHRREDPRPALGLVGRQEQHPLDIVR